MIRGSAGLHASDHRCIPPRVGRVGLGPSRSAVGLGGVAGEGDVAGEVGAHLFHLAAAASGAAAITRPTPRARHRWTPRPSLQWTLDAITSPAIVVNGRSDLLAANLLGQAMHADLYTGPTAQPPAPPNFARFIFLDPAASDFYPDWNLAADTNVAILRASAGRDPHDKALHDLVGELSTRSPQFAARWSAHNVRIHGTGTKAFHHAVVGDLTLAYETLALNAEPGLQVTIYTAEPASPTAHALTLLGTWAATELHDATQPS